MQTFTIGLGRTWWIRLVGRNPLVRRSDRIEAWSAALALLVIAIATPMVGAIGTSVYGARSQHYAEEAESRHEVVATAMEDATVVELPAHVEFKVRATWNAAGRVHDEIVEWSDEAKGGERKAIWVDDQGGHARPPSPPSTAVSDAVGIALSVWLGVIATVVGAVSMIRRRLNHRRYAQWEHEINASNSQS
jgi:putative copper export protein